jgi:hypothetical protein
MRDEAKRSNVSRWLAIYAAIAVIVSAPVTAIAGTGIVRLIDGTPDAAPHARIIDGVWKRVLPSPLGRVTVLLHDPPPAPRLRFSMGLQLSENQEGTVRFQVILRGKGRRKLLYRRDLDRTGWVDDEVDLSKWSLEDKQLLFQKLPVGGKVFNGQAEWGEPMLVPGNAPTATSLILISIDTLRADRVGV